MRDRTRLRALWHSCACCSRSIRPRRAATPLEVVRSAYREPTAVLEAAAIPPVERDSFDERAWPDDQYGLVPRTLGDLGDPDLAPLMLAWGMAKAAVLRARAGTDELIVTRRTGIERYRSAPLYAVSLTNLKVA